MGGQTSKQQQLTIAHQRFTTCQLSKDKQTITTWIPIDFSKFDFEYWRTSLEQIKKQADANFLHLPSSYDEEMPSMACNANPRLKMTFENFPFLFDEEIANRALNNNDMQYFGEEQLWVLLYSLVKSQRAFSNLSLKVGDIHPHNIFINQQGYPRVACQFSWPNQKTNFQKMFYDKILRFIAPQQMKLCQTGLQPDICYSNTSQAFSIGMTLLSAGLLQKLEQICNMKTYEFNRKYLEYSINRWMTLRFRSKETGEFVAYSDELKDIVRNLCSVDPKERFLPSKVYEILEPYEKQIMALERFVIKGYREIVRKDSDLSNINNGQLQRPIVPEQPFKPIQPRIPQSENLDYKQLFDKYAASGSKEGSVAKPNTIFTTENFSNRKDIDQLESIKKDLQLEFTESVLRQKQESSGNTSQQQQLFKTYSSQNSGIQGEKYVQFKERFYEPTKIVRNETEVVQQPIYVTDANGGSDLLSKIQMQIRESQKNFPQRTQQ